MRRSNDIADFIKKLEFLEREIRSMRETVSAGIEVRKEITSSPSPIHEILSQDTFNYNRQAPDNIETKDPDEELFSAWCNMAAFDEGDKSKSPADPNSHENQETGSSAFNTVKYWNPTDLVQIPALPATIPRTVNRRAVLTPNTTNQSHQTFLAPILGPELTTSSIKEPIADPIAGFVSTSFLIALEDKATTPSSSPPAIEKKTSSFLEPISVSSPVAESSIPDPSPAAEEKTSPVSTSSLAAESPVSNLRSTSLVVEAETSISPCSVSASSLPDYRKTSRVLGPVPTSCSVTASGSFQKSGSRSNTDILSSSTGLLITALPAANDVLSIRSLAASKLTNNRQTALAACHDRHRRADHTAAPKEHESNLER